MPHNFNGRFWNASGLRENFGPKTLDWWSETAMIFYLWKSPPKIKWRKSFEKCHYRWRDVSLWLRRWNRTISTMGRVPLRLVQKKRNGCALQWKQCCFFIAEAFWAINLLLMVKQFTKIFIWGFWDVCGKLAPPSRQFACSHSDIN
jgi:hypothetical protein